MIRAALARSLPALCLLAACTTQTVATPPTDPAATSYVCADGAKLTAVYGKQAGADSAALTIDGVTSTLLAEPAASGVRYGWPSDGSNYVWWTKGDMATLYWKDGSKGGAETVLHADCNAQ